MDHRAIASSDFRSSALTSCQHMPLRKSTRQRWSGVGALFVALAALGPTVSSAASPPNQPPTINVCAEGMEQILPGDFYACKAVYELKHANFKRALGLLEESARWANKNSQHVLGVVYYNGDDSGVPKNRPLGLAWLELAGERKDPEVLREYNDARAHASSEEVAAADQLFSTMKEEFGDAVAGVRAQNRYNEKVREMTRASQATDSVVVYGLGPNGQRAEVLLTLLSKQAEQDFAGLTPTVTVGPIDPESPGMLSTKGQSSEKN